MSSLREKALHFVKRKRRNSHDSCRGSGNYLDSNRLIRDYDEDSRKNGEECSTLVSTYYFVHNAHRLVLIPSTLCASYVSIKEHNVEGWDNRECIRKGLSRYIPKECNDIFIGYLRGECLC